VQCVEDVFCLGSIFLARVEISPHSHLQFANSCLESKLVTFLTSLFFVFVFLCKVKKASVLLQNKKRSQSQVEKVFKPWINVSHRRISIVIESRSISFLQEICIGNEWLFNLPRENPHQRAAYMTCPQGIVKRATMRLRRAVSWGSAHMFALWIRKNAIAETQCELEQRGVPIK